MKLLKNDITSLIVNNYSLSVGYASSGNTSTQETLSNGIIKTYDLTPNNIKHIAQITMWTKGSVLQPDTYYQSNNRVYICLYSPKIPSSIAPSGNLQTNIILDDNYVWRYVCDIDYVVNGEYVVLKQMTDNVKKGCVSGIYIIKNSNNLVSDFKNGFFLNTSNVSGNGLSYVVENNQNTNLVSDILVQNGGSGYKLNDVFVLTDKNQSPSDYATVTLTIENGSVKLSSFTNGQNYDYLDIIIVGDGSGATVSFNTVAGVLTNVTIPNGGSNYTWAKAIIVNSNKYVIGLLDIEPLNGYSSDFYSDKYVIEYSSKDINSEINYYGLHRKVTDNNKYKNFEDVCYIDAFTPTSDEIVILQMILG